jgi:taspase, threonine aspartase, 1
MQHKARLREPIICLHLGAGRHGTNPEKRKQLKQLSRLALSTGLTALRNGGSAVQVCVEVCKLLEDSPLTNAGFGSQLTENGTVECDASLMESRHRIGTAVSCVSRVKNPIDVTEKMYCNILVKSLNDHGRSKPVSLCGLGAELFAEKRGCSMVPVDEMITQESKLTYDYWNSIFVTQKGSTTSTNNSSSTLSSATALLDSIDVPQDTVGVICVDIDGVHAVCSSSGGITYATPGRIGPAGIIGASNFVEQNSQYTVSCCATGHGDDIITLRLAQLFCSSYLEQTDVYEGEIVNHIFKSSSTLLQTNPLYAGVMAVIDAHNGNPSLLFAHSTDSMIVGSATVEKTEVFISTNPSVGKVVLEVKSLGFSSRAT